MSVADELNWFNYFQTTVYRADKPEFIGAASSVCDDHFDKSHPENEIYPVRMSPSLLGDQRLADLSAFIAQAAWEILASQGYAMGTLNTYFTEMFAQQHFRHSAMEQHVHGLGAQIVGMYFLDAPQDGSSVLFHDPKCAKVQINLPEADSSLATPASNIISFHPEPGMLLLSNAWLAHSFTRSGAERPMRMIHCNIGVRQAIQQAPCRAPAEVV